MRNTEEKDDENNKGWRGTHNIHIFTLTFLHIIFQENPVCLVYQN